jgi:hypothetical protein
LHGIHRRKLNPFIESVKQLILIFRINGINTKGKPVLLRFLAKQGKPCA